MYNIGISESSLLEDLLYLADELLIAFYGIIIVVWLSVIVSLSSIKM